MAAPNKAPALIPILERPGGEGVPHAWGYGRVSTLDQDLECKAQTMLISRAYEVYYQPEGYFWGGSFLDPATEAYSPLMERQAGSVLMGTLLRKGDVIIVGKSDRFSKSLLDYAQTLEKLRGIGAYIHTCDTGLNTKTDMGRLITGITALLGNHERERMSSRRLEQIEAMKLAGLVFKNQVRYGFRLEFVRMSGQHELYKQVPDLKAQLLIERMYYWHVYRDIPLENIALHLGKHKIPSLRGKTWSARTVQNAIEAWAALEGTELDLIQRLTPDERRLYHGADKQNNFALIAPRPRLGARGSRKNNFRLRFLREEDYEESQRFRALALREAGDGDPESTSEQTEVSESA